MKAKSVLGIDSSTLGLAWCLVTNGKPVEWGTIDTSKLKGMNEKLYKIATEYPKLLLKLKPDFIYVEKSIYMRNIATFRILSYVVGTIISLSLAANIVIEDIEPMVAKTFYGYTKLNRRFVAAVKYKLGTTAGNKLLESMRKSQVQRVNVYNFPEFDASDHNISDACSQAIYGYNESVKPIKLVKSRDIALDLAKLDTMGLSNLL